MRTLTATAITRDTRTGASEPRRSESRPMRGDSAASRAAAPRKAALITTAEAPSALRRNGTRTSTTPKAIPARAVSHIPAAIPGSTRAGRAWRRLCGSPGAGFGIVMLMTRRKTPATPAAAKAGPVPTRLATAPTTGPTRAPPRAAAKATPRTRPRRSTGAAAASQARLPAQVQAPATPCTKRAPSSTACDVLNPKTRVATLMTARPRTRAGRTPSREARTPPGRAPISVPTG